MIEIVQFIIITYLLLESISNALVTKRLQKQVEELENRVNDK